VKVKKIFIDGREGTTGLGIFNRIAERKDLDIIILPEEKRKEREARREALNSCDIAILCLPDAASREAVEMIDNADVTVIDASTAHRTSSGWTYGLPELSAEQYEAIKSSKRIAVPGCHASGFITLVSPLVKRGVVNNDICLSCYSLTGYSGGGKKMIAEYESEDRSELLDAPRQYALSQAHKHLPEMIHMTGLLNPPVFCPVVSDFYSGMEVTVPLFSSWLNEGWNAERIKLLYSEIYNHDNVIYTDQPDEDGLLSAVRLSGTDKMEVSVFGNDERMILTARYDNLGKGASGAALQCLDIVLGLR
jgi:N-acetyl-gamma-glutamyl-phosphate reductase